MPVQYLTRHGEPMSETRTLTVNGMTVDELLAFHRARFGGARMEADGDGGDNSDNAGDAGDDKGKQEQTFTQADIDRIVKERVGRVKAQYADYDDLKARAGEKATAEERIAALENEIERTRLEAAVARISNEFGLSDKQAAALKYAPSEEAAREIAEGLAAEASARKKASNVVPREGSKLPKPPRTDERTFARELFGGGS